MRRFIAYLLAPLACIAALFVSCADQSSDLLAPYQDRELFVSRVPRHPTPDLEWLGGRVAAVGVNKGTKAGLDASLVFLKRSNSDDISSYLTLSGANNDKAAVISYGGTPVDSLSSDTVYTFWVAKKTAYAVGLSAQSSAMNPTTYYDTTTSMEIWVKGTVGGEQSSGKPLVQLRLRREETALKDRYLLFWTPTTTPFRRVGANPASTGSWDNLMWHAATPNGTSDNIYPAIEIGVCPPNVDEATPLDWSMANPGEFVTIWMANSRWTPGTFTISARGYAWFRFRWSTSR